ncbi:MAG: GldG family protein [Gammaproteobacteria bacterium]|nr:GldG family protein [Gammaproteobacteria bacterium]MBU1656282.1 GldG family protein [Gammaproteobacteria bacterium]MBU1959847.1 GldG family protein [Gammaproteobacteria bacterium]
MSQTQGLFVRRINNLAFYLLFVAAVGLIGWLSTRYEAQWDWTAGGRNSLSEPSISLLQRLEGPLSIKCFAPENALLRDPIRELIGRYRRYSDKVELAFINPDLEPDLARKLGITVAGELMLEYQGRSETLTDLNEESITNAIQRLALGGERWVGFLAGHGERAVEGQANFDLGDFGRELERKGYHVRPLNLAETPDIPANINLLVIPGPRAELMAGEVAILNRYLEQGGNLLWLLDPGPLYGLEPLADALGLKVLPGTVVDVNAYALGIKDPAVALITAYPEHPAVGSLSQVSLFPHAAGLEAKAPEGWESTALLETLDRTWNETGPLSGQIQHDEGTGEKAGPLAIAYLFDRHVKEKGQRVLAIGDGDFLSNAFLGNGGNLNLGVNLIRWLTGDERLLNIPAKTAPDLSLEISQIAGAILAFGFLMVMPLALFGTGFLIWWRRRNR